MNTYIYVVRHGEVYNPRNLLYARLPKFRLSKRGEQQVQLTGKFLKTKHIDAIYSSPMLRAVQTAKIIQKETGTKAFRLARSIIEIRTSFQGQIFSDLSPDQREVYLSPKRKPTDEDVKAIATRMINFVQKIAKQRQGQHIVIVTHGDPIMALRAAIKKLPLEFPSIRIGTYAKHAEVTQIEITETGQMHEKSIFIPDVYGTISP